MLSCNLRKILWFYYPPGSRLKLTALTNKASATTCYGGLKLTTMNNYRLFCFFYPKYDFRSLLRDV